MPLIPFDDRDGQIWYNGKLVPWRDAKVHVLNHGLHYGSSVFEGERAYGGKIFKLREHTERLENSAGLLGFKLPFTRDQLEAATQELIKVNNITDGYIRPVAFRGSEQMAVAARQTKIHVAIATWEWPPFFRDAANAGGVRLRTSRWARPAPNTAPTASKAAGIYMIATISKHEAEDAGYTDALMLDFRGLVAESTGSNIFLVMDGKLHTPIPDCFLNGITRQTVIGLAKKRSIDVIERQIKPEEIKHAQEVFLCGTAAEVTGVSQIDDMRFQIGAMTETLSADYLNLVRA
ncbi:MAG: branched-chain amino acid aminotransferase [Alphaproteobacteria bacterium]